MSTSAPSHAHGGFEVPAHIEDAAPVESREAVQSSRRESGVRRRVVLLGLLVADLVALSGAFVVTQGSFWFTDPNVDRGGVAADVLVLAGCVAFWLTLAGLYGLYSRDERRLDHTTLDELGHIFHFVTVGSVFFFFGLSLTSVGFQDPFAFWLLAFASVFIARVAVRLTLRKQTAFQERVAILGVGEAADSIARKLLLTNRRDMALVGFFAKRPRSRRTSIPELPILGTPATLLELVEDGRIDRVVVVQPPAPGSESLSLLRSLGRLDVRVDFVPASYEAVGPTADLYEVRGLHLLGLSRSRGTRTRAVVKRATDVVLAGTALVLLSPLLLGIAVAVKLTSQGPVLYRGGRVGRNGTRFQQLKFRTMKLEFCRGDQYGGSTADAAFAELMSDPDLRAEFELSRKLEVDPRVTGVGRFLRRTSLDELPSLVNVVTGDLSLVGPRTVTVEEFEEQPGVDPSTGLTPYWEMADVRPGITGYAVVNGRSRLSYSERVRLDMAYASSGSTKLDLLILAKTVRVLFSREGAA